MNLLKKVILGFCLFFGPPLSGLELESGAKQVRLIELYTSQSCSSCPPAEAWLSRLKASKKLWTQYIPVSYHVSYWNHLSWKDPFSKVAYSNRQRDYSRVIKSGVYTPQIVLDGMDFRNWRSSRSHLSLKKGSANPGSLKVVINKKYDHAKLNFKPSQAQKGLLCYGAYLESGHATKVKSGENAGLKLQQDFVVLDLFQAKMHLKQGNYSCELNLTYDKKRKHKEKGLAFWVVNQSSYKVIQATGGPLK